MTFVRRLALKISGAVVRFASPGCKEWAEGLAREVAVIDGDRRALGWAIGSIRVLFDRREAPLRSVEEIPAAARRLASEIAGMRFNGTILTMLLMLNALLKELNAKGPEEHIGYGLVVLACLYVAAMGRPAAPRHEPAGEDVGVQALFYRADLERFLAFYSRSVLWSYLPGAAMAWVGLVLEEPGGFRAHPVLAASLFLVCAAFAPVQRLMLRRYQRRLRELDEVLAEGGEGTAA
jgi:hypothetical protein